MLQELKELNKGKTLIIGIGNQIKSDDGVGPRLINELRGQVQAELINAEIVPENYLGKIVKLKPETILVIDAIEFGGRPGDVKVIKPEELAEGNISTHNISPKVFAKFITDEIKAEVIFIGIQPKTVDMGTDLSREVEQALRKLTKELLAQGF